MCNELGFDNGPRDSIPLFQARDARLRLNGAARAPKLVANLRNPHCRLLTCSLIFTIAACSAAPDASTDFVGAADLCIAALSGGTDSDGGIAAAGWSPSNDSSSASSAPTPDNQKFTRGQLNLALDKSEPRRCLVDGSLRKLGSLEKAKTALSKRLGPAVRENESTYRWPVNGKPLLVKLSQTNTESEEVLRLYVFSPSPRLINGI